MICYYYRSVSQKPSYRLSNALDHRVFPPTLSASLCTRNSTMGYVFGSRLWGKVVMEWHLRSEVTTPNQVGRYAISFRGFATGRLSRVWKKGLNARRTEPGLFCLKVLHTAWTLGHILLNGRLSCSAAELSPCRGHDRAG